MQSCDVFRYTVALYRYTSRRNVVQLLLHTCFATPYYNIDLGTLQLKKKKHYVSWNGGVVFWRDLYLDLGKIGQNLKVAESRNRSPSLSATILFRFQWTNPLL